MDHQNLKNFRLPKNYRGKPALIIILWNLVSLLFFKLSPQFFYNWRNFLLRIFGAKIGKNVMIRPSVEVVYPWNLIVCDNSWVGDNVVIYNHDLIEVGSNSVISQKSYLCTASHHYNSDTFSIYKKPITIGNKVWIATDVFINPGVSVCDNVVVAARSTVTKSIMKPGVYIGSPVKFFKKR